MENHINVYRAAEESPRPVSEVVPLVAESMAVLEGLGDGPVVSSDDRHSEVTVGYLPGVLEEWLGDRRDLKVSGQPSANRPGLQCDPQVRGLMGTLSIRVGSANPGLVNMMQVSAGEARTVSVGEVEELVVRLATSWGADHGAWQVPQRMEIKDAWVYPTGDRGLGG